MSTAKNRRTRLEYSLEFRGGGGPVCEGTVPRQENEESRTSHESDLMFFPRLPPTGGNVPPRARADPAVVGIALGDPYSQRKEFYLISSMLDTVLIYTYQTNYEVMECKGTIESGTVRSGQSCAVICGAAGGPNVQTSGENLGMV
jgi:hypothetical protein